MSNYFASAEQATIDRDNPRMALAAIALSAILNDLYRRAKAAIVAAILGDVAATASFLLICPDAGAAAGAALASIALVNGTTFATSDTDYWTLSAVNLGPAGTGTTALTGSATANSTQATGGAAITLGVARPFVLTATAANLQTAAGDVIQLTLTKTGSPADLSGAALRLGFVLN